MGENQWLWWVIRHFGIEWLTSARVESLLIRKAKQGLLIRPAQVPDRGLTMCLVVLIRNYLKPNHEGAQGTVKGAQGTVKGALCA